MRTATAQVTAASMDEVFQWLRGLEGCPPITRTIVARCRRPVHGDDPASWFYVEADAEAGVARTRCLGCGGAQPLLDSAERWTFPTAWACQSCRQSIAEIAYGVAEQDGLATWMVMAARCVDCGHVQGLTDAFVPPTDIDEFVTSL